MRHRNESVVFFYCSVFLKTKQRARISLLMLGTCLSQTFSYLDFQRDNGDRPISYFILPLLKCHERLNRITNFHYNK